MERVLAAWLLALEERGYVERQPHPRDGRAKIVVLTRRGWDCIRTAEGFFADAERRWTEIVGAEKMADLRADLGRIVAGTGAGNPPLRLRPLW